MFSWDKKRTSQKLEIERGPDDHLDSTVIVRDGAGFKNAFGDYVSYKSYLSQVFKSGGRYYFQLRLIVGSLMKIGVASRTIKSDQVRDRRS